MAVVKLNVFCGYTYFTSHNGYLGKSAYPIGAFSFPQGNNPFIAGKRFSRFGFGGWLSFYLAM